MTAAVVPDVVRPDLHVVAGRTADEWADRIRGHLARTVEGFVAAGRDLQAAKDELPYGEWGGLLAKVGLTAAGDRMLRSIARHGVLEDRCNATVLPAGDYTTLYQLSRLPEPELRAAIDAGEVRPDMRRADAVALVRRHQDERPPTDDVAPLPEGAFSTVVADPPWQYGNKATRGAAAGHYDTMTIDELCALDVADRAAPDAHLYLWVTNSFLREGFDVMAAWGFTYKTCLTWVKTQMGLGNYFRGSTEHILFGVRGSLRTSDRSTVNWFTSPRGRHSAKPESFYDLVEGTSPGPYLEMFARRRRLNWTGWGDQS